MELTVEQMVGKLLSFYNGIHGEFFKEVADKLISLEKASTPSPSACKASPSGCKSESGEKVIAAAIAWMEAQEGDHETLENLIEAVTEHCS